MPKRHSYPPNAKRAFGVDLGEYLDGIHTVDFLIWIPGLFPSSVEAPSQLRPSHQKHPLDKVKI